MKEKYILLVEDNPDDEELTLMGLKSSGVLNEVVVVRDGEEAVQFLLAEGQYKDRVSAAVPAVILLDLKLPKLSGLEVLER
ncbi:MAG: response regulator, partial [Dethiobacteria bacterium]|nr:response regulator [Dethiobacteria bacterium]